MRLFSRGKKAPVKKARAGALARKARAGADPFDMASWKVLGHTRVTRTSWKR
jgi:hypothetical protein